MAEYTIKQGSAPLPKLHKFDALPELEKAGCSIYRIRKGKLLAESALQSLRGKKPISWNNIGIICRLLSCQPGDILKDKEEAKQ